MKKAIKGLQSNSFLSLVSQIFLLSILIKTLPSLIVLKANESKYMFKTPKAFTKDVDTPVKVEYEMLLEMKLRFWFKMHPKSGSTLTLEQFLGIYVVDDPSKKVNLFLNYENFPFSPDSKAVEVQIHYDMNSDPDLTKWTLVNMKVWKDVKIMQGINNVYLEYYLGYTNTPEHSQMLFTVPIMQDNQVVFVLGNFHELDPFVSW